MEPCIDLMVAAHNRLAYTKECLTNLVEVTDWNLVRSLTLFNVGSSDGVKQFLHSKFDNFNRTKTKINDLPKKRPVVDIMRMHIKETSAPFLAKIDNDTIVPLRWLNIALKVLEGSPSLQLLGLEAMRAYKEIREEEYAWTKSSQIGGLYLCRRTAFAKSQPKSGGNYFGFDAWQRGAGVHLSRGWITPSIKLCLLDHLPFEPWLSLKQKYIKAKWQRNWGNYPPGRSHLWDWKYPDWKNG